jgi:hypothetical protein
VVVAVVVLTALAVAAVLVVMYTIHQPFFLLEL